MIRFNVTRISEKLRALFALKTESIVDAADGIASVLVVENDRLEWEAPGREIEFMGIAPVAAGGAGNSSELALLNPTGSGIIAVVTFANHRGAAAGNIAVTGATQATVTGAGWAQVTGFTTGNPRDSRMFGQRCALQMWARNNTAGIGGESFRLDKSVALQVDRGFLVITPGLAYVFSDLTLNEAISACYFWRERPQEAGVWS